jgi:hypothetical protein
VNSANLGDLVAWLWTDTLATLLAEHDGVALDPVAPWVRNPVAYRLEQGDDPLALARRVLPGGEDLPAPEAVTRR